MVHEMMYIISIQCSECKEIICNLVPMDADKIRKNWSSIVITTPYNFPKCESCGKCMYTDRNSAFDIIIREEKTKKIADKKAILSNF